MLTAKHLQDFDGSICVCFDRCFPKLKQRNRAKEIYRSTLTRLWRQLWMKFGAIWWSQTGSNRRPPACKAGALPAELWPHILIRESYHYNIVYKNNPNWWVWEDLNFRPHPYQGCALTERQNRPFYLPMRGAGQPFFTDIGGFFCCRLLICQKPC